MPIRPEMSMARMETYREVRAPQASSAKMSRPRLSVPSQCWALGAMRMSVV